MSRPAKSSAASKQQEFIEKMRALAKPSPVRLHHEPRWLLKRIHKSCGRSMRVWEYAHSERFGFFLDHWGTVDDGKVFVSEPYPTARMIAAADAFSESLGLQIYIRANSHWNPGSTIRLEFRVPPHEEKETPPVS